MAKIVVIRLERLRRGGNLVARAGGNRPWRMVEKPRRLRAADAMSVVDGERAVQGSGTMTSNASLSSTLRAADGRRLGAAAALGLVLAAGSASAQTPSAPPAHRVTYEELAAARVNPLGLESRYFLAWRSRLYRHDAAALRDNYVGIGASAIVSPALFRHGVVVEAKPLTLLTLSAGVHRVGYFGSFQFLQGYASPTDDFSDTEMRRRAKAGDNVAAGGFEVELRGQLLGKVGPVVVRTDTSVYYTDVDVPPGATAYYTPRYDLLMPNRGFALTSDNDVLYFSKFGLVAGVRTSVGTAFYDPATLPNGEDPNGPTVRLGPLVAYTFFDEPRRVFNKPTVFLNAAFWLAHRFRTGADVSQAMPMIAAGFRFEGELFRRE